jgi:ParB family chromosome partitioning protein
MTTDTITTNAATTIPLNHLIAWTGNVRKTGADTGLAELAASIAAHDLLQSLVVRKDKKGKYAVVAGRRRLLALTTLAEAGTIPADKPIPCHVIDADANATEISLVENALRTQMHPADEFDAFLDLLEGGMQAADIAARFGVTETVVQQRLKLARVSPVIIAVYRKGDITLAHVMAFAVTDDHAAQEHVWDELQDWQLEDPDTIREALTEDEVTAKDRRVTFVTLKAYEKAGGTVRRDLFAQDGNGVFIEDAVLLESLVAKKLEKAAASVRKEGWKWVEIRSSFDYGEWSDCERRHAALSEDAQERLNQLSAKYDEIHGTEGDEAEIEARLDELSRRMDDIEDGEKSWQPKTVAMAGAIVTIGGDGKADIHYGYVKPEDAPKKEPKAKSSDREGDAPASLSAALTESLTAHRSAAISAVLTGNRGVALACVVNAMAMQLFYNGHASDGCVQINVSRPAFRDTQDMKGYGALEREVAQWTARLPGDPADLWAWCLKQSQDDLLDLLACCAGCAVNAVRSKGEISGDDERLVHADALAAALRLDMAAWFKPKAANYFSRVSKDEIVAALYEVKGATAPAWAKAKKSELAALAERELADTGWLPALLRRVE